MSSENKAGVLVSIHTGAPMDGVDQKMHKPSKQKKCQVIHLDWTIIVQPSLCREFELKSCILMYTGNVVVSLKAVKNASSKMSLESWKERWKH